MEPATSSDRGLRANEIRSWLGWYLLITTGVLAASILLLGGTPILPIEHEDKISSFEIIIPFFLAQMSVVFSYYGGDAQPDDSVIHLPVFVVKGPPIVTWVVLGLTFFAMCAGGMTGSQLTPSGETFKGIITFVVALMNVSTVLVIARVFATPKRTTG